MSTAFDDRSSNTERSVRDVIATGTTTVAANFYKARVHWEESQVTPGELVPPQDATVTDWAFA